MNWILMPVVNGLEYTLQAIADCLAQSIPCRILVINQGASDEIRAALEALQEREEQAGTRRVLVWSHDPMLPSLSATWNQALDFVWAVGGSKALVVNNDVRLAPCTVLVLSTVLRTQEALFVSAIGVTQEQFEASLITTYYDSTTGAETLAWTSKGGPDFSCFLISKACHAEFRFDEAFIPAYCVTPDTLVLMSGLHWVPIGTIRAGDELIGVDEHDSRSLPGTYRRRCYQKTKVTEVRRRIASCLRIELTDGRTVVCSTDHKWLTKYPKPGNVPYRWRSASDLQVGYRIATPLDVWQGPRTYNEGWLAGIYDGEGCLRLTKYNQCELVISQNEGSVLDRIQEVLHQLGIPHTGPRIHSKERQRLGVIEVAIRRHVFRLLGQVRPTRLFQKFSVENLSIFSRSTPMDLAIASIRPVGDQEVVTLETTSHTYLANGMIAHNCEDLDFHRRVMLAGKRDKIFSINLPFLHYASGTLNAMTPTQQVAFARRAQQSRDYYQKKWGGPVNEETFWAPFNRTPLEDSDEAVTRVLEGVHSKKQPTTPYLQFQWKGLNS